MAMMNNFVARQENGEPACTRQQPRLQAKLRLGPVDDPLEREADRVADAVVSGQTAGQVSSATSPVAQRSCAKCEAEDDKMLRRKTANTAAPTDHAAHAAVASLSHGGAALSQQQRAYFEPRFGRDLSAVRLHVGGSANAAAARINARAFTLGNEIGFAQGEFRPDTEHGRHLLAHELAHVVQQSARSNAVIQRASIGTGATPNFSDSTTTTVPDEDRERVEAAMAIIDDVVAKPQSFSECHDQFKTLCPGGTSGSLASVWRNATIWRITTADKGVYAKGFTGGSDMAYTQEGYDQGAEGLAGTLLHEAGHNCGILGGSTHWYAEKISNYCIGPGRNGIAVGFGGALGGGAPSIVLSYRRFLGDFASGRLKLTLGADLDLVGSGIGIIEGGSRGHSTARTPVEYGSVMAGAQTRIGGWGGSRYGGIALRFETGFGVGQFALRQAANENPRSAVAPTWILQVGPRAEFLVKTDNAHVFPFSISAALRHVQPINGEARALTAIVGSVEFPF
jgi:Domain of unknown function (DUF4157)